MRPNNTAPASVARKLAEGQGTGRGSAYLPWLTTITTAASAMQADTEREKQGLERHWSERQKLTASIGDDIAALSGEIAGISQIHSSGTNNALLYFIVCFERPQKALSNGV